MLVLAAAGDLRSRRIPNWLPATLALAALALARPEGAGEWLARSASLLAIGGASLAIYLLGGMGGGDLKLLAAAALWIPFGQLPLFVLALALAGGLQAAAALARRRLAGATAGGATGRLRLPYAVSIAAAGLAWALASLGGWRGG